MDVIKKAIGSPDMENNLVNIDTLVKTGDITVDLNSNVIIKLFDYLSECCCKKEAIEKECDCSKSENPVTPTY